jgi:hypothetical protein
MPTFVGPPPRASVTTRIASPMPMIVTEKIRTASW